jgi:hypothetical protein
MNTARLDVINSLLLAHCFTLAPEDEAAIHRTWECPVYSDREIDWPRKPWREMTYEDWTSPARPPQPIKICSMPTEIQKLTAAQELSEHFDLCGVPGFYKETIVPGPGRNAVRAEMIADFGPWRINLPEFKRGLLVPYDRGTGQILGIQIFRSVRDTKPFLLSSRGLPCGSKAVAA